MTDPLLEVTSALVAELATTFSRGQPSPALDAALAAYASHWRRTGASRDRVAQFVERLIARSRDDAAGHREEDRLLFERLSNDVRVECLKAYDLAR